eukprot:GDKH01007136.1.p1 GENE.GDKH01007136.1~~GDKH01007136.1.p1  ORF type:complete len:181 (-),score=20.10 GDKH01007136.1:64-606(-)
MGIYSRGKAHCIDQSQVRKKPRCMLQLDSTMTGKSPESMTFAERFSGYFNGLTNIKGSNDFFDLNQRYFGSQTLEAEKVGTGAIFGMLSGYTFRHAFRAVALLAGIGFVSVQALAYQGYITVDWKRLEKDTKAVLDLDKDGELTEKDVQRGMKDLQKVLTWGMPSAAGFAGGFWIGARWL